MYTRKSELYHFGIKGMKWGVRRFQNKDGSLTSAGRTRYAEESNKTIKTNKDGSYTVPKGFVFNRVGKSTLDINKSGALYMSYGKEDAARYVKSLGPTLIGKLTKTAGESVQHIKAKGDLKMPSDSEVAEGTAKLLLSNEKLFKSFSDSIYSLTAIDDVERDVTRSDVEKALKNPLGKEGQKLAYSVSSFLGDERYSEESKAVYEYFRKNGYDAIPDVHDRLSGTSKTAMIVINPDKVEITSTTTISKDVMREAKDYVKSLEKLKASELIK